MNLWSSHRGLFYNLIRPAMLDLIRAAASTQTLDLFVRQIQ